MIAEEGMPIPEDYLDSLPPLGGGVTVDELVSLFRDRFGLDRFNDHVKRGTAETLRWLPATGMPVGTIEHPERAMLTSVRVNAPAGVRVALALLLRDIILAAMQPSTEPSDKPGRTKKGRS